MRVNIKIKAFYTASIDISEDMYNSMKKSLNKEFSSERYNNFAFSKEEDKIFEKLQSVAIKEPDSESYEIVEIFK